jgi:hypothetical protein
MPSTNAIHIYFVNTSWDEDSARQSLVFNLKHLFYNSNIDLKAYNQTAPGVLFLPVQLAGLRRLMVLRRLAGFRRLDGF